MNKENEKNSSIEAGELSDDDLGSVAGGLDTAYINLEQGGEVYINNDGNMVIQPKNGEPFVFNSKDIKKLKYDDSNGLDIETRYHN